jgi:hypothetical protein
MAGLIDVHLDVRVVCYFPTLSVLRKIAIKLLYLCYLSKYAQSYLSSSRDPRSISSMALIEDIRGYTGREGMIAYLPEELNEWNTCQSLHVKVWNLMRWVDWCMR